MLRPSKTSEVRNASMIKAHIQRMSIKKNTVNKFPGNISRKEQEGEKKEFKKKLVKLVMFCY